MSIFSSPEALEEYHRYDSDRYAEPAGYTALKFPEKCKAMYCKAKPHPDSEDGMCLDHALELADERLIEAAHATGTTPAIRQARLVRAHMQVKLWQARVDLAQEEA